VLLCVGLGWFCGLLGCACSPGESPLHYRPRPADPRRQQSARAHCAPLAARVEAPSVERVQVCADDIHREPQPRGPRPGDLRGRHGDAMGAEAPGARAGSDGFDGGPELWAGVGAGGGCGGVVEVRNCGIFAARTHSMLAFFGGGGQLIMARGAHAAASTNQSKAVQATGRASIASRDSHHASRRTWLMCSISFSSDASPLDTASLPTTTAKMLAAGYVSSRVPSWVIWWCGWMLWVLIGLVI